MAYIITPMERLFFGGGEHQAKDIVHVLDEVEFEGFFDVTRDIDQVLLVVPGEDDLFQSGTVTGQDLLLDSTDLGHTAP